MRGFTFVETLVVAAVFIIVGTLLASILVNNTGLYNKQTSLVTSGLSINDAVSEIETNIRQASAVVNSYPLITPLYTTNGTTLVLKIPSFDVSGIINNTYDYVVITKDAVKTNLLMLYVFPDSASKRISQTKVLSSILQSIAFTYLDQNDNIVSPTSAVKVKTEVNVQPTGGVADKSRNSVIVTNLRNI
ncbi:MAG: type II secretion system protein [Microgenomates group bacterium]|jgi:type II secretory pathway pseudopilin PulG